MATQQQQQQQSGASKPGMRKPVFIKVDQLKPGTSGHTLTVKVVSSKTVLQKGRPAAANPRQTRIAECQVGDETGTIVFTARNEQVDLMKPETTVILRNAKIDMFKGSMRLAVDKWGRVEVTEPAQFTVASDGGAASEVGFLLKNSLRLLYQIRVMSLFALLFGLFITSCLDR